MTTNSKPPCAVCSKSTSHECAHVECPNRKRVTAAVPADSVPLTPGASYRIPHYSDK